MATASTQETIIAQGVRVQGEFVSQGDVYIDGEVVGSIHTERSLRIGEPARIEGNVAAENAVVAGEVKGNMHISDRLELMESSVVTGDIQAEILLVAAGARINGYVRMGNTLATEEVSEIEVDHP